MTHGQHKKLGKTFRRDKRSRTEQRQRRWARKVKKKSRATEDILDAQIARDRLAEIESDPKLLIEGEDLRKQIDNLKSKE